MKYLYLFISLCCAYKISAQVDTLKFIDGSKMIVDNGKIIYPSLNNGTFTFVEQKAEFPGGQYALNKWITENLGQDPTLKEDVTVNAIFTVNQKGLPVSVTVQGDTANGRGGQVTRLIQKMPRWKPASQQGKTVKMRLVLPIKFSKIEKVKNEIR